MRSIVLGSVGLCLLAVACGGSDGGGLGTSGGSPGTGGGSGPAAVGGSATAGAGGAAASLGGAGEGGGGGAAGSSASAGSAGSAGDGSLPNGGGGQGGSGGAGQAGSGGMPGSGLDPAAPPGKNFDLSHFALQLPVVDGASVQQISNPNLATYTSQYFYTGPDGAMVFWCPVTGAHTPNTHYPRTELRELAVGGDWAITGTHSLTASFKVMQTPPSKGTIIGQIHGNATGGTAEVLKLEWLTTNQIIASVEDNNDPATQINMPLGTYTVGEVYSYAIKLENRTLTVTITGGSGGSKSITSPYTAASWTQDKYYFKLGDYVQLNTGPSTDGGRVSFYSFSIQHG